jgi:dihydropteroate synthase
MRERFTWKLPRASIALGDRTAVMGILNVTPDSFSDGGMYFDRSKAIARAMQMEEEGADIIDVGGESTRPGSEEIPEEEELRRVLPVIEALASVVRIPISIDTYRSNVARRAIEAGAQIVNDISGFRFDAGLAPVANDARAGVVLMHSRGSRDTLHTQSRMVEPIHEVTEGLADSVIHARRAGISGDAIVVDPGIGFGKAAEESLRVLKSLNQFSKLGYPLLVGTSRKSFIRKLTPEASAEALNWGTAATIVAAIMGGTHIVRVHDVRQSRALANMTDRIIVGA